MFHMDSMVLASPTHNRFPRTIDIHTRTLPKIASMLRPQRSTRRKRVCYRQYKADVLERRAQVGLGEPSESPFFANIYIPSKHSLGRDPSNLPVKVSRRSVWH